MERPHRLAIEVVKTNQIEHKYTYRITQMVECSDKWASIHKQYPKLISLHLFTELFRKKFSSLIRAMNKRSDHKQRETFMKQFCK